ncbi:uncharacterized protein M421DRAFT_427000 [Didymella exigua CBS 183.55]|uniref:DDE-1 domain-containing protein n=1 Tax=Didymella exigua CBS 183.55 TaxID=1150837 RepID=A0A6A5R3Z3_9PLEO|nr:uncharacterized protein M421DRAFT_427000 [Didymella exigua CBS 183.55]KAF1922353.1 hypothetical protein M421DRAFT_427000 [Didymella exigua CBS 183.55]
MANKLLGVRATLKIAFNQAKDRQRMLQEDLETISAWFKLVEDTKAKYSLVQLGDREWVTVIQSVCAAGSCTLPFIIYKGRVHISAWYKEADIPRNWKLSVSESGWTNNALGLEWLKHFDAHTKAS